MPSLSCEHWDMVTAICQAWIMNSSGMNDWFRRHVVVHKDWVCLTLARIRIVQPIVYFVQYLISCLLKGVVKSKVAFLLHYVEISHGSWHTGNGSLDQHTANWQVCRHIVGVGFGWQWTFLVAKKVSICYIVSFPVQQVWLRNPRLCFGHPVQHHLQWWGGRARYWPFSLNRTMKSFEILLYLVVFIILFQHFFLLADQCLHVYK